MINKFIKAFSKKNESLFQWLLVGIIIVGFLLRFSGIAFGLVGDIKFLPNPDESNILYTAFRVIQTGSLNPHPFWVYPTFYIYLQALAQLFVYMISVGTKFSIQEFAYATNAHHYFYFFGRLVTTIFGTASIYVLYQLTKDLFDKRIAIIASALLSVTFVHIWASQYVTTDVPMTFFGLLVIYFSAKILKNGDSWKNYLLVAIFIGLAMATRYNAFIFFIPFIFSHFLRRFSHKKFFSFISWKDIFDIKLIATLVLPFIVFVVFDPFSILDLPHFLADYVGSVRGYRDGIWLNLSVHGNMPAWLWYLKYSFTSGLYWPMFIVAAGGLIFGIWPLTKNKLLVLSYLVSNYFLINSMATVMDRNLIQMSPYLMILGAIFIFNFGRFLYHRTKTGFLIFGVLLISLFGFNIFRAVYFDISITKPDTRVQAAYWMKDNIPEGSTVVGLGSDLILNYLRNNRASKVYSVSTLGPSYKSLLDKKVGDHYVIVTSVDYNWAKQYYKSPNVTSWAFDGLSAKEIYDYYQKLKNSSTLVKEFSDPLFKNNFYGPGYLEMSSTVTTWHNPKVELYKVYVNKK